LGVGLGYVYDLRLSRTVLSWLPLALALPLLPVFGWLSARGELPKAVLVLVPVAVLAGAALLIANGLVDLERDATSGKPTIAVRIGRGRAWLVHAVAFAAAIALALALAPVVPAAPGPDAGAPLGLRLAWSVGMPLGVVVIGIGAGLLAVARPALRERGWELEGIGTAMLGLGWLAGAALAAGGGAGT
jgi:4-hydroxybenzoate polyprenyltransferase